MVAISKQNPGIPLEMARAGATFILKGGGITTLSGGVVLTAAGTFKAIPEGSAAVIAGFMLHLHTVSDEVEMHIGYSANADGTGDFVEASPVIHIETGGSLVGSLSNFITLPVPMYFTYSTTCKAVAVKLTTNDDSASIAFGIAGWIEETG